MQAHMHARGRGARAFTRVRQLLRAEAIVPNVYVAAREARSLGMLHTSRASDHPGRKHLL